MSMYRFLPILVAAACSAGFAQTSTKSLETHVISEAGARQALTTAETEAKRLNAPCALAVVDSSGYLVAFLRMDGSRPGSQELALGKARTSALLRRPSSETEDNVDNGRYAFTTSGFMTLRGGMPLMENGEVVGAIGIAGLNKDNDVRIAQAVASEFERKAR